MTDENELDTQYNCEEKKLGYNIYVGVKLKTFDKVYPIMRINLPVKLNDLVVVVTSNGEALGQIVLNKQCSKQLEHVKSDFQVKRIVRIATPEDVEKDIQLELLRNQRFVDAQKIIRSMKLPIRLLLVEIPFDERKTILYYKKEDSKNKIPAKKNHIPALTTELETSLNTKIELREVGARGEAKLFGGIGACGRPLCCAEWLNKNNPITIKMAKEQGLSINIPKLSGLCDRLMCCIAYEKDSYQDGAFKHD